jgi:hypothetical protein
VKKVLGIILVAALMLSAFAVFFACGAAATGAVEVRVTDAPANNITSVNVTVDKIEIHRAGAGNESGWETIPIIENGNVTFDLCQIAGNETLIAYSPSLAVGNYTQLRMHIVSVNVTMDGVPQEASVPSEWLKLVRPFDVTSGGIIILTLDFDVTQSIVVTGAGDVKLKPVVRLLVRESEATPE